MKTCIVVSHWTGHGTRRLRKLVRQLQREPAGCAFRLVIVSNGGTEQPLRLPSRLRRLDPQVIQRENSGYNLGAWEAGWRQVDDCDAFLFLQDECVVRHTPWLSEFVARMAREPDVGLIGESMMWRGMGWQEIRESTACDLGEQAAATIDQYRCWLAARGTPEGPVGEHLQSLVLFIRRSVLEQIGGFPVESSYRSAVAAEIGISRRIAAEGLRLTTVREEPFYFFGHPQWMRWGRLRQRIRRALRPLGRAR